jgi:hypothetical protein
MQVTAFLLTPERQRKLALLAQREGVTAAEILDQLVDDASVERVVMRNIIASADAEAISKIMQRIAWISNPVVVAAMTGIAAGGWVTYPRGKA